MRVIPKVRILLTQAKQDFRANDPRSALEKLNLISKKLDTLICREEKRVLGDRRLLA